MPPAPTTPKVADGANAAYVAFHAKRTSNGTRAPVAPPPVIETDEDVFSPTDGCAGAFGFADIEQIVRDAVGSTAQSPASNHSLSIFLGTNTPPLSTGSTLLHAAPGSGPAVGSGRVSAVGPTTWIAAASPACKPSSSESATIGSIGYAEVDPLASWPSASSKPASFNAVATSGGIAVAAPVALMASAGADSVKHTTSSNSSHSAPNSTATSPTTAAAAPATGAVPTSNAASHYKTKRCRHFDQTGWCPYQHRCVFAHGDREFTRYNMQKTLNNAADGSGPTTSQVVRDHIERNVRQLIDEYEEAVAEASAKAIAKSTAVSMDKNSQSNASLSASAQPGQRLAPPALMSVHNGVTGVQMQAVPTQSAPPYHQHQFLPAPPPPPPQQPFAMLGQQPILLSAMPGSPAAAAYAVFPSPPSINTAAPQSFHTFAAHHRQQANQQQQILFAMPPSAPALYQFQQPQQQQQQIFFVGAPYLQAGATPMAAYPAAAAPYPRTLMPRFA